MDRAEVRALAEKHSEELKLVVDEGGNVFQKSIDQNDLVDAIGKAMDDGDAEKFYAMYAEEMEACTNQTIERTNQIIARTREIEHATAEANLKAESFGGAIGVAILLAVIVLIAVAIF